MSQAFVGRESQVDSAAGLPISWYFDAEILEIERRELFAAGPTYAAHVSRVTRDGDYAVLGGQQLGKLVVQHEGRVHLLSNVCRHRQAEMLTGSGHAKNIVCPIHNWAYDLNGRQLAAPHFDQNPCLDLERTELAEWNGMLFTGPRDVRNVLSPLASWTELSTNDYVLERIDEEEHDFNWKAFLEVYLEDYHIGVVHPGFRAMVDPNDLRAAVNSVSGDRFFCEQVNVRWPLPPAGTPKFHEYYKVLLDVLDGRRPPFAAIWLCLFSGQLVEWYPFTMVITTYTPLSPTRTRLRSEYYFDREIAESRRDYVETGLAVLDEVTGEDHMASQTFQNGRNALWRSGENVQGPYQMPMEQGLRRFHDCLREIVHNA
jgi:choline monooxygenase